MMKTLRGNLALQIRTVLPVTLMLAAMTFSASAWAATIYVDDDNVSGIEDGTLANPYSTVDDGMDAATAGDSLFVFAGDYYPWLGEMQWTEGVRIEGEDSSSAIIHGLLYNGEATTTLPFEITSVRCDSIEFRMLDGSSTIHIHGNRLGGVSLKTGSGYTYTIENNTIDHGITDKSGANWTTISGNVILNGRIEDKSWSPPGVESQFIENNTIHYQAIGNIQDDIAIIAASQSVTIQNNSIECTGRCSGIDLPAGAPAKIIDNEILLDIDDTVAPLYLTSYGISASAGEGVITGNNIHGAYYGYLSTSNTTLFAGNEITEAHTGLWSSGMEEVQDNVITHCRGDGMILDGVQGPVHGNVVTDNDSAGIKVIEPVDMGGGADDCIGRNIIRDNGYCDLVVLWAPTQGETLFVQNNVWDHETAEDILAYDICNDGGSAQVIIDFSDFIVKPDAPALLSPEDGNLDAGLSPQLRWHSSEGAEEYWLQVSEDSTFTAKATDISGITDTTFTLTGLSPDTEYFWHVGAGNLAGYGDWSPTWRFIGLVTIALTVSPDSLDFGEVPVSNDSSLTLRIKSTGTNTLQVSDINSSDPVFTFSDTAFSLAPAESVDVTVTFTPTAAQIYAETLTLLHNAIKGATIVPVSGEGLGGADVSVSPDTLEFGQVEIGQDSSLALRIKSTGTDTLMVSDIEASDPVLTVSDTSFSLAPAESTDITVTFIPTAEQSYSEILTILHNAAKGTLMVPVTGTGISNKPVVLSMVLSDPSPIGPGPVSFTFTFDRTMDVSVAPEVSYGLASPYEDQTLMAAPGWSTDSLSWTGLDTVAAGAATPPQGEASTHIKGDGLNTVKIQGAQDPDGRMMNPDVSRTFFIDTVAPFSTASSPEYASTTSFTVRWSGADPIPASGIASYAVFASEDGAPASEWIADTTVTAAVYAGAAGHSYSFYSIATDSAGNRQPAPAAPQCSTSFDLYPPQITATTIWTDTSFGGPFAVSAQIEDSVGIALALLWYRTDLDTLWQADTMTASKDLYQGAIPEQTAANTVVEYYVRAEDVAEPANSRTDPAGAPGAAYSFTAYMTGVASPPPENQPGEFVLQQNVPNPFNAGTKIGYTLPLAGYVRLEVFNILGQKVAVLADAVQQAGEHAVRWDGRDGADRMLSSGVYLCRLSAEGRVSTRKMVLLR